MLPSHRFDDPELNRTLEVFLRLLVDFFADRLSSVVLHGSVIFDDLAPGYGDLDFLAVVRGDLDDATCEGLATLRKPLRSGHYGVLPTMLEGAFLPRGMLDPTVAGKAFWWGTSGERQWQRNELGWFVLHVIRQRGIVVWGEDVRRAIPETNRELLLADVRIFLKSVKEHGAGVTLHSVDWVLTVARMLLWLREGKLSSKSQAADWGAGNARGRWREFLPQAKEIRLHPALAGSPEGTRWLRGLTQAIRQAAEELERELEALH
jgi:hypothetical protein